MNFNTVLDTSSIIWDKADFQANESDYYQLINSVSSLLDKMKKEQPTILFRNELLELMIGNFPFDGLPNKFYDFGHIVYSFLSGIGSNFITYSDNNLPEINSIPNQIKAYYNTNTKEEIGYLLTKMHSDNQTATKYFTFEYLWDENNKLKTETKDKINTYETIISDNGSELEDFFAKLKPLFEHNSKHNCKSHKTREAWDLCATKKDFESQLSCFKSRDKDIPQKILNKAIKYNSEYIGYDEENEVWVRFKCHKDNFYHGFDEYDDRNKIPETIRTELNK